MTVRDVMTRDPFTIDPEAPLGTAMDVMRTRQLRHLPVADDAGRLVGIVTDRDLRHAAFAPALAGHLSASAQRRLRGFAETLEELKVRDAMTWGVVSTHPAASLVHAALVMSEHRVGCLPVIDDGKVVGILTERDLLMALGRQGGLSASKIEGFLW